jgi:HSP20 family protein
MTWTPAIEVAQREGKPEISAELPGIKPEDVKITVDDDMLILEGERTERKEEGGDAMRRTEIHFLTALKRIRRRPGSTTEFCGSRCR